MVVEKLSDFMLSDGKNGQIPDNRSHRSRFNRINARPEWIRAIDLFRVKVRLTHTYNSFHIRPATAKPL